MSLDLERIEKLGAQIAAIAERIEDEIPVSVLAPLNEKEELAKVREHFENKSGPYNPQFVFDDGAQNATDILENIQGFLASLRPTSNSLQGRIEAAYWEKAQEQYYSVLSRLSRSPGLLTAVTALTYGLPKRALVKLAQEHLTQSKIESQESDKEVKAEEVLPQIQSLLRRVGFEDWKVVLREVAVSNFATAPAAKEIRLKSGDTISLNRLKGMIIRQIATNVERARNGEQNRRALPFLIEKGLLGYQVTEFGLGAFMEAKLTGQFDHEQLRDYAARYLAAQVCLSGTFYDGFNAIQEYVGVEKALSIVTRIKRGFSDTSEPGGHLQIILYWDGYHKVKEHLLQHPDDLPLLFIGKIGLQDLPLIKELVNERLVNLPPRLPEQITQIVHDVFSSTLSND